MNDSLPQAVSDYLYDMQSRYRIKKIGVVLQGDDISLVQFLPDGECIVLC